MQLGEMNCPLPLPEEPHCVMQLYVSACTNRAGLANSEIVKSVITNRIMVWFDRVLFNGLDLLNQ